MSEPSRTTVLKLGGSLLDLPDLFERLDRVIRSMQPLQVLIVVGGGAAADVIRDLDAQSTLTPSQANWAAIDAMSYNARLLCRLDRRLAFVRDRSQAEAAWNSCRVPILDACSFLKDGRLPGAADAVPELPESWDVTSDSIAAWVALNWPASDLLFVKSCNLTVADATSAAAAGLVDQHLPQLLLCASAPLRIGWIDLTADDLRIEHFTASNVGGRETRWTERLRTAR